MGKNWAKIAVFLAYVKNFLYLCVTNAKERKKIMKNDLFVHYNTPEEAAEAFRKMVHAKDEWLEQVHQLKQNARLAV